MTTARRSALVFLLALIPSAWTAWTWRSMPQFGLHHDDALYLAASKSLAEGHGYRIPSLPGEPFQTKYPPLFPALLAPVWRWGPPFPSNLVWCTAVVWLGVPLVLLLFRALFRRSGFSEWEASILILAAGIHPLVCVLSSSVMSDLLCLGLFVAALLLAEGAHRSTRPASVALLAGLVAGAAYLTRTSAGTLLLTVPACLLWRRQRLRVGLFAAGMLPAVAGWQVWTSTHALHTRDPALLYYTSYLGMEFATVHWGNLASVVWHNADAVLRGLGKLVVFGPVADNAHLQRLFGAAAIAGTVRIARRSGMTQYAVAGAAFAATLLIYFFPADERILLPLFPLVLMGFWAEAKNFLDALRRAWSSAVKRQRIAVASIGAVASVMAGIIPASYLVAHTIYLPALRLSCVAKRAGQEAAYSWIRGHTPVDGILYAYDDPLLYLYTGRHAVGLPSPPGRVYEGDDRLQAEEFAASIPQQARERGLDYLFTTKQDFYREDLSPTLWEAAAHDPSWRREYLAAGIAVYRRADSYQMKKRADRFNPASTLGDLQMWLLRRYTAAFRRKTPAVRLP